MSFAAPASSPGVQHRLTWRPQLLKATHGSGASAQRFEMGAFESAPSVAGCEAILVALRRKSESGRISGREVLRLLIP